MPKMPEEGSKATGARETPSPQEVAGEDHYLHGL